VHVYSQLCTIDSLWEVVYEKSVGTEMNDLDLSLEVVQGHVNYCVTYSLLNIFETVRDRGLVPKDPQSEMAYGESNGHMNDDVT